MASGKNPEDLTSGEKDAFNKLNRRKAPPRSLEEKTMRALHSRGLLKPTRSTKNWFGLAMLPKLSAGVIAASIIFLSGFAAGKRHDQETAAAPPQSLFALLIYDDDNYEGDPMAQGEEYGNWMFNMGVSGRYAAGREFRTGGRILKTGIDQIEIHELTGDQTYGAIGGFFLIEAKSYEDALVVASGCPHLKYGGTIEVREIQQR